MKDSIKNIISNILGMAAMISALVHYFMFDLSTEKFVVGIAVSLMLFFFKANQTRNFVEKYINSKIK
ncbi:MAG: hypothetical protein S4CHLAM20_04080 [Chlamydiia bacterium]|nr:hypothetical protein [Chlamydiia bacterium]